jgi:hypothetical protein
METYLADRNLRGVHESALKAYNILRKVKEWLADETPPKLVIELIHHMEQRPVPTAAESAHPSDSPSSPADRSPA